MNRATAILVAIALAALAGCSAVAPQMTAQATTDYGRLGKHR